MSDINQATIGQATPAAVAPQAAAGLAALQAAQNVPSAQVGATAPQAAAGPAYAPWESIESSPQFAGLTYQQQQYIRDEWFRGMAPQRPEWATLNDAERAYLHRRFVTSQPSVIEEDLTNEGRYYLSLAEQLRAAPDDEAAINQTIVNGFSTPFVQQSTYFRGLERLIRGVINLVGGDDVQVDPKGSLAPETVADRNAYEYMLSVASEDAEVARRLQRASNLGGVLGNFFDIGASIAMAAPVAGAARAGQAAARMVPAARLNALSRFMRMPSSAFVVEAAIEAGFMTLADRTREVYNEEVTRFPTVTNAALRTGVLFGTNFLGDMALWGLFKAAAPLIGAARRVYTAKGFRRAVDEIGNADDLRAALRGVPPELMRQLPDDVRVAAFRELHEDIAKASRMTFDDIGSDEWQRLAVKQKGYELVDEAGGGVRAQRLAPDGTVEDLGVYPSTTDAFNRVIDNFDVKAGINPDAATQGLRGQMTIRRVVEGNAELVSDGRLNLSNVRRLLQPAADGRLLDGNVRTAVKGLSDATKGKLGDIGEVVVRRVDAPQWRRLQDQSLGRLFRVDGRSATWDELVETLAAKGTTEGAATRRVEVVIPDGAVTSDDVARLLRGFEVAAGEAGAARAAKALRRFAVQESLGPGSFASVRHSLEEVGKTLIDPASGAPITRLHDATGRTSVGVLHADGTRKTYRTIHEAFLNETPHEWLTDKLLKRHLREGFGYTLTRASDNRYYLKRGTSPLRQANGYATIDELLLDNPDLMPKRPLSSLKGDVEFDAFTNELSFVEGRVSGPADEVAAYMDKTFANYDDVFSVSHRVVDTPAGKVDFQPTRARYILELDDIGFRKEFRSLDEAKDFLRRSKDDLETMNDIALAGGSEIEYGNGVFRLRLPDGSYAVSRSLEGIRPALKQLVHDTDAYPDLLRDSGLPEGYIAGLADKYRHMFGEDLGSVKFTKEHDFVRHVRRRAKYGQGFQTRRKFGMEFRPFETMIRTISEDIGNPQILDVFYKQPRVAYDVYRQKYSAVENAVRNTMRGIDSKQSKAIHEAMMYPQRDVQEIFRQVGAKYTDRIPAVMDTLRGYYDVAFEIFGIDGFKFLREYIPRFRKYFDGAHDLNGSVGDMFNKMGMTNWRQVPELKFFAENLRVRDVYELTADTLDGVDEALLGYFRKGFKKKYLAEPLENARAYTNTLRAEGTIDDATGVWMESFATELSGMVENPTKQAIVEGLEASVTDFYTRVLGVKSTDRHLERVLQNLRTATVGAHMSWKFYLPMRNMQQIWTTLGWRIGNDAVLKAERILLKNPQGYVKALLESGVIQHGRAAILEYGLETANRNLINRFTETGMLFYRNSDDFNRAVTALSAWVPYDEAVERLAVGAISDAEFLSASRIDRLPSDIQQEVLRYSEVGDHRTAKNILARAWVDQTQFTYLRAGDPQFVKRTIVGRMFGHYSHYPRQFRENLLLAFGSHVPKSVKMKSAAQLALNTAGLYFVFEKALGINARNYNPLYASMFGGGPYYHLMNLAVQSMDSSYRGKQARAQIPEQLVRNFVPGNALVTNTLQALDYYQQGHYVEAYARFNGAPVIDPNRPTAR